MRSWVRAQWGEAMVYLNRADFSAWLATTTPANIFSAAAFFLAFNAPEDEQADRLGELQGVALTDHRLSPDEFRRALDMAQAWARDWSAQVDTVAEQLGFAPLEPFDEDKPDALPAFPAEALPPAMRDYAPYRKASRFRWTWLRWACWPSVPWLYRAFGKWRSSLIGRNR